jgi:amino acid transporter
MVPPTRATAPTPWQDGRAVRAAFGLHIGGLGRANLPVASYEHKPSLDQTATPVRVAGEALASGRYHGQEFRMAADSSLPASTPPPSRALWNAAKVIVISSVTFTFISYWRTAAVVLCDLASTAYYIGGIVENAIGPAAPWFILAVMLFSYAVRSVYIESSALFVRGGVYRVVKEAMGGFLGKLSVSALMFDYILTGPTSGVSAGQYIVGLVVQVIKLTSPEMYAGLGLESDDTQKSLKSWGSVLIACGITLYFFRQNLIGIHESSDKALKIMIATTVMAVIMLLWCGVTLVVSGSVNSPWRWQPDLNEKVELQVVPGKDPVTEEETETWVKDPRTGRLVPKTDEQGQPVPRTSAALGKLGITAHEDPLGLLARLLPDNVVEALRHPHHWLSLIGILGLFIAFGHSILAMSGEETLAQVYREVESPKLPNFKKAAFIVFVYSLVVTAGISFLAVMLIPDEVRMKMYSENLIGGLTRYVLGPPLLKLFLEGFVVVVGFLILAGAVNTAIIGSNGVLNRVAEDGVMPDWFLRPHPRYGTTYRLLYLILFLQLSVIVISGGDMILLGEAYAFGVVWSFVFKALAMVVLRFKDRTPREYKVPFNLHIGGVEIPVGLSLIFLVLLLTALLNLFTKEVATAGGLAFTAVFLTIFMVSEHYHEKRRKGGRHEHLEQFNRQVQGDITPASLGLTKPYRKLVAIRSPQNLFMLEKALAETDPETTSVVVMTAKVMAPGEGNKAEPADLDTYDERLMTAVVDRAERAGKQVRPLIVPTNNPLHAVLKTAQDLQVQELVMGASNKYTADEQLEQIGFYWINLHGGETPPLTVRILGRDRDVYLDLGGGNRIPRQGERRARSVAELRAMGVGVDHVFLIHDGTRASRDLFRSVLTMLDPQVALTVVAVRSDGRRSDDLVEEREQAEQLKRAVDVRSVDGQPGPEIVRMARERQSDIIVFARPADLPPGAPLPPDTWEGYVVRRAPCQVLVAIPAVPPEELAE